MLRQVIGRPGLVTTEIPSLATWNSVYLTPPSEQSFSSSGSIAREASEMSVSPAQNFSNPPLVPAAPTVISTSEFSSLKSSAAASANGCTVDEPSMVIVPERSPPPLLLDPLSSPSSEPHAATPNASTALAPAANSHCLGITAWVSF